MHLSKQLAAKLSAALVALTTVIVPSMAADIGTVTSDTGLNLRSEASTDVRHPGGCAQHLGRRHLA